MAKNDEQLVAEIRRDFLKRQEARRPIELNWRLNMDFVAGNQFSQISPTGDIEEEGKQYFWQQREVFNHIAPILETRLAKLSRVKAKVTVRPATPDDDDVASASLATKLIDAVCKENDFSTMLSLANCWSEVTGSAFFKVSWDPTKGKALDSESRLHEGEVSITLCPPFEIFPADVAITDIDAQTSIIHAKVLTVSEVERIWGKKVQGDEVNVFSFGNSEVSNRMGYNAMLPKLVKEKREDSVIVLERYEKPTHERPNGRFTIVAGDALIFDGELPYLNGEDGARAYPFSRQTSLDSLNNFFGSCVVERVIPVQRAYNAVKNRKHEYMNRLAVGVLAVEDGSVDTDALEEEGLPPGKILVYRQGSAPPTMMHTSTVPAEFAREEERLLNEFVMISGVSEVTTYSQVPANVASGVAISLLLEQDDARISLTADSLRACVKRVSMQILRLYRQFAKVPRVKRITGDNGEVELASFSARNIDSEDIVFDTVSDIEDTLSARRAMVYDLLKLGLLTDDNGKLTSSTKTKVLDLLGFGTWENARSADEVHIKKAQRENLALEKGDVKADVYDDHRLHLNEHIKLCVSSRCSNDPEMHERVTRHINEHKQLEGLDEGVLSLTKRFEEVEDAK